ncbi:hypothetical protein OCU04_006874 [Sclerotinia nivalis]|uniref:Uncharacterized protein n=1 Tax=Sclerotinia nivalis TaxID=352851 RepID=A0A9X0AKN9_9HELO|nr:hypothetical protein OCU04_006874 [Sclerotinia nivalis]
MTRQLKLLPGLQLHTLTILCGFGCGRLYDSDHIRDFLVLPPPCPCREFHHIAHGNPFHTSKEPNTLAAQIAFSTNLDIWGAILERKTDATQGTVSIFQSSEPGLEPTGTVYNVFTREVLAETTISLEYIGREKLQHVCKALEPAIGTLIVLGPSLTTAEASLFASGVGEELGKEISHKDEEFGEEISDSDAAGEIPRVRRGKQRCICGRLL